MPVALVIVNILSITKVITVKRQPINTGTIIPPKYILFNALFGPSCDGQNASEPGFENPDASPKINLQKAYPTITQTNGAIHEIALLDFFTCTDVDGFTFAVDFVSAITFDFLCVKVKIGLKKISFYNAKQKNYSYHQMIHRNILLRHKLIKYLDETT